MSTNPDRELLANGYNFTKTTHSKSYPTIDPTKTNLSGRKVLITGSSKSIGLRTAISYARAGASAIVLAARSDLSAVEKEVLAAAKDAGQKAPKIISVKLDVTDRKSVEDAAEKVRSELTYIDILISNAGILEPFTPIIDSDPDVWWATWKTNLLGPYLILRAFLPLLISSPNKDKTVIGVSSIGAHLTAHGASGYQTAKLALLRLLEFVNSEYGNQGILAYGIHPGAVMSDMGKTLPESYHASLTDEPEVAADTMVFLTKERQDWLAGRYISCTWDMDELLAKRPEIEKGDLLKVRLAVETVQ